MEAKTKCNLITQSLFHISAQSTGKMRSSEQTVWLFWTFLTWSASDVLSMLISSLSAVSRHICSQLIRRSRSRYRRMTPEMTAGDTSELFQGFQEQQGEHLHLFLPVLKPLPRAGQGLWFFHRLPRYQSLWFSTRPITCLSERKCVQDSFFSAATGWQWPHVKNMTKEVTSVNDGCPGGSAHQENRSSDSFHSCQRLLVWTHIHFETPQAEMHLGEMQDSIVWSEF